MIHLVLLLLILTGVRTNSLYYICEDQIDGDIWAILAREYEKKA